MTTTTYRMIDGELVAVRKTETPSTFNVIGDVPAYRSVITGETIEGRSAHREHLAKHGCEEVGNEGHPSTLKREDSTNTIEYRKQLRDDIKKAEQDIKYDRQPTLERLRQASPQMRREMGLE